MRAAPFLRLGETLHDQTSAGVGRGSVLFYLCEVVGMEAEQNVVPIGKAGRRAPAKTGAKPAKSRAKPPHKKHRLKEAMISLLGLPVRDQEQQNRLSQLGLDENDMDNGTLLAAALFAKATEGRDVSAFREIRSLIGEDESEDGAGELQALLKGLTDE